MSNHLPSKCGQWRDDGSRDATTVARPGRIFAFQHEINLYAGRYDSLQVMGKIGMEMSMTDIVQWRMRRNNACLLRASR